MAQSDLNKAKETKYDEYYTRLSDITEELRHYKEHFKGKTVFCNCDDPYESNFFKYFAMNFNHLGLKKLITTCYATSPVVYTQLALFEDMQYTYKDSDPSIKKPYKVEITEVSDLTGNGAIDLEDIKLLLKNKHNTCSLLEGNGDFRSEECIELLKESDIVVTNPPFSLFRDYIAQLMKFNKKFLIIGNQNALHYKEIFPLIQNNKIWCGYRRSSGGGWYMVTKELEAEIRRGEKSATWKEVDGVFLVNKPMLWYTNLDIEKRHEEMILYKKYSPSEYPHYYNYDGIDVNSVSEIPYDYWGYMGVPDSFLEIYNPDQFEIIGVGTDVPKNKEHISYKSKNLITYEEDGKIVWSTTYTVSERKAGNSLRLDDNGKPGKLPYSRIIIRRKEQSI